MAKWQHCADVDFGVFMPNRLEMRTMHGFIRSLNVKNDDVMGISVIYEARTQTLRVTFVDAATCASFLSQHGGLHSEKLEGKDLSILVKDSNVDEKYVRLTGIPHSYNLEFVKRRFREFGNVLSMRWEKYHVVEDEVLFPVLSTWLICRMTLDNPIPSYVTVGEYRVYVKYHGQTPTCKFCDQPDHMGRECPTLRRSRLVFPTNHPGQTNNQGQKKGNPVAPAVIPPVIPPAIPPVIPPVNPPVNPPAILSLAETVAALTGASVSVENLTEMADDEAVSVSEETESVKSSPGVLSATRVVEETPPSKSDWPPLGSNQPTSSSQPTTSTTSTSLRAPKLTYAQQRANFNLNKTTNAPLFKKPKQ